MNTLSNFNLFVLWATLSMATVFASHRDTRAETEDAAALQDVQDRIFRAGAATSNISPPLGEPIVGGWSPIPATHIHDELYARCLVLDDGATRLAIVVCDNVGIVREVFDAAKTIIEQQAQLPRDQVLMASTHTHSATSARGPSKVVTTGPLNAYQQFVARRIADGVRRAINQLEPARIGWHSASEPRHVFNRRWHMRPGPELRNPFGGEDQVRMNPPRGHADLLRPAGPTDPEIAFLSVVAKDGRPLALLANYSLHYVGGIPSGHVSADYFGVFADRIQQLLGGDRVDPPFVGMLSNGTSGNINNIDFRGPSERREPYEKMRIVAQDVAAQVYAAHQDMEFHDWVPLAAVARELTLEVRKPTIEQLEYLTKVSRLPESAEPYHRREQIYAERVFALTQAPDEISVPLQVVRIGELGIAAIPFEVFVETGLEIKERCPFERAFTIELANGSYGYLPTPQQHELGGYETWLGTNFVERDASTKIAENVLEMFEQVRKVP